MRFTWVGEDVFILNQCLVGLTRKNERGEHKNENKRDRLPPQDPKCILWVGPPYNHTSSKMKVWKMMSQTPHRRFWDSTFWGSRFMVDFSASLGRLTECTCFWITDLPKSSMYGLFTYIWLKSMLFLRWCFSKNSGFPRQALVIFSRINVGKWSYRGKSQNPNFQTSVVFQTAIARVLRRKSRHFFFERHTSLYPHIQHTLHSSWHKMAAFDVISVAWKIEQNMLHKNM